MRRPLYWCIASEVITDKAVTQPELQALDTLASAAIAKAGDNMTGIHLQDVRAEIERILAND